MHKKHTKIQIRPPPWVWLVPVKRVQTKLILVRTGSFWRKTDKQIYRASTNRKECIFRGS